MEKKWFRYYGLYAVGILALTLTLSSARAEVQDVVVSVEVEIQADNTAAAVERAQKKAFQEAVLRTLPPDMSEAEKQAKLVNAASYIESFRLVSQKEEGGKLIAEFQCQVRTGAENISPELAGYEERFALEFVWNRNQPKTSLAELRRILIEDYKVKVGLMKLQNGSWWIEMRTAQSPESIYTGLSTRLRAQAEIRLVKDLEGIFSEQPKASDMIQEPW